MTKLLSSSIIYLQLMMVAAWIITGSRQVSAWIRHRRWNRGSNLRNWHHFGRLKFIWLHDNKKPCSFNRLAVKNEQCDYHDHHHLYNGGDIFLRKHVFLYQNVVWWVSNKPQEIKNVWMNIWLINLLLFIHKKFPERSSTIILGYIKEFWNISSQETEVLSWMYVANLHSNSYLWGVRGDSPLESLQCNSLLKKQHENERLKCHQMAIVHRPTASGC